MISSVDKKLVIKLLEHGVDYALIPGFIRSLANAYLVNPAMTHSQANKRLKYLGWDNIEIDYHTLQLAITSLETKGMSSLEYKSAPWYLDGFKPKNMLHSSNPKISRKDLTSGIRHHKLKSIL